MDEQSVGSDDTPATSNVAFDQLRTYDIPLDDDVLEPYERRDQPFENESTHRDAGDTSSQPQYQENDDSMLSFDFHTRRNTHDDAPEDDDEDFTDSFAVGELSSSSLVRNAESLESSLSAIPESEREVLQSRTMDSLKRSLVVLGDDKAGELAAVSPEPGVLVPSEQSTAEKPADDDQPDEHATPFASASSPPLSDAIVFAETQALDVGSVAETSVADIHESALTPAAPRALAPSESENRMAPVTQTLDLSTHSAAKSTPSSTGNIDERTHASEPRTVEDEVSLTPSEVFDARSVPRPKFKSKSTENWDKHDDDDASTINTHGDNYWSSQYSDPEMGYPKKPSTIEEGDEEEESLSSNLEKIPPSLGVTASPSRESFTSSRESFIHSRGSLTHSSQRSRSSGSSQSVGVVLRSGSSRRRDEFREVEVSLDGFMHQNRHIDNRPMNTQPLIGGFAEDKSTKLSRASKFATLGAVLCLLATVMFSAVNIGPFVVQPDVKTQASNVPASSPNDAVPSGETTSSSTNTNTTSSDQEDQSSGRSINSGSVPSWIANTFALWNRPYVGKSIEIPVIWTHEKTGGEILLETFSKCLGKVVAGDGKRYDIQNTNAQYFASNTFKVLSTDSHVYLNVDLFSKGGLERAAAMRLTQSRVSDVIYTPFLLEASEKLFPPKSSTDVFPEVLGRLLVVFRDPIERALNRYEITRVLTGNDALSLTEYSTNPVYSENNPLTRDLLGLGPHDGLGQEQIQSTQESISQYVFVGLYDQMEESITRFATFFQWFVSGDSQSPHAECTEHVLHSFQRGYNIGSNYAISDPVGYNILAASYTIDMLVYKYAKAQFVTQGKILRVDHNRVK